MTLLYKASYIRLFLMIAFSFISINISVAQAKNLTKIADSIINEANTLYRSEWASGHGTQIFASGYVEKKLLSGGYFSYEDKKNITTIFFSKDKYPVIIATVKFDISLDSSKYIIDTITRKFTETEKELYIIRSKTAQAVLNDTLFKFYPHTSLNLIPIIKDGKRKVYVITAQTSPDEVLLGNDYLINFNKDNDIISKKKLHNNLIPLKNGDKEEASSHQHLGETSPFITATDICAFKLWKSRNTWVISFVISAEYVSAWHFNDEFLEILTQAEFEKIMKNK